MSTKHAFGWRPDLPDKRDLKRSLVRPFKGVLPPSVDLRPKMPAVYDQGGLGSCTGNGIAAALEFEQMKQGLTAFTPSRLFIYYNERVMEGTVSSDAGASIRDGIKSVASIGAPPESDWPYDISQFTVAPPQSAYDAAKLDCAVKYLSVDQTLDAMKQCLADGYPIVGGFTVYQSFDAADLMPAIVPMPGPNESVLGGHCILIVGYDDARQMFTIRNSWGVGWGDKGYGYMPYAYLTDPDLADDFWAIELVGTAP